MKTRKRTVKWLGLAAALGLVVLLIALWLTAPANHISRDGFYQLREGMTQPQIEEILGAPAQAHPIAHDTTGLQLDGWVGGQGDAAVAEKDWSSGKTLIIIGFDRDGRAAKGRVYYPPQNALFARLQNWLGL